MTRRTTTLQSQRKDGRGHWARKHAKGLVTVEADWRTYGKAAGPRRNQVLVDMRPDLVLAFPGGRGTADAVRRARAAGLVVREIAEQV